MTAGGSTAEQRCRSLLAEWEAKPHLWVQARALRIALDGDARNSRGQVNRETQCPDGSPHRNVALVPASHFKCGDCGYELHGATRHA